jgi:predicted nucleic-acid-binding protein
MKSLDTNIIIRFLVNDDYKQGELVKKLLLKAEKNNEVFFVSSAVVLEIIYVLDSVYGYSREEIIAAFESMLLMPVLLFENSEVIQKFLVSAANTGIELEDLLIGITAKEAGCEKTITFDKKAAKSDLFELLN